jgi:hypothetical protein
MPLANTSTLALSPNALSRLQRSDVAGSRPLWFFQQDQLAGDVHTIYRNALALTASAVHHQISIRGWCQGQSWCRLDAHSGVPHRRLISRGGVVPCAIHIGAPQRCLCPFGATLRFHLTDVSARRPSTE